MIKIDENNNINLTRGDTAYIEVSIMKDEYTPYTMQKGDTVTFSIKKNVTDTDYTLRKVTDGNITILPAETKDLTPGKYFYDVQLDTALGEVFTVIPMANFYLEGDIT